MKPFTNTDKPVGSDRVESVVRHLSKVEASGYPIIVETESFEIFLKEQFPSSTKYTLPCPSPATPTGPSNSA